ncbi:MAG: response regulator [Planctomycetota bacterium]|jgi:two-component system chemotaxis response regulator CheY|nr:response regulator [Planctomycetota bacterium]
MKILVVDDSSTMRRIICNTLKTVGQEDVVQAGDGVEALAVLEKNPDVKLILSDWNMPNMNGLDFLKKVRETKSKEDLPTVMVTTEAEKTNVVTAIKAGANNYIVKPFTPEILSEKVAPFIK